MNEPFVPLFPNLATQPGASRAVGTCNATILPASKVPKLQPVAPVSPGPAPQFIPSLPNTGAPSAAPAHGHSNPVVTLQRDGDHVSRIHIVCSCGQVIDLDCAF